MAAATVAPRTPAQRLELLSKRCLGTVANATKHQTTAYAAIRKRQSPAYRIVESRLGPSTKRSSRGFMGRLSSGLQRVCCVVDVKVDLIVDVTSTRFDPPQLSDRFVRAQPVRDGESPVIRQAEE